MFTVFTLMFSEKAIISLRDGMEGTEDGEMELAVSAFGFREDVCCGTVENFNFGTFSWREGPRLPHPVSRAEAVQASDGSSFLIMGESYYSEDGGGGGERNYPDTVYEFDDVNYARNLREERPETARERTSQRLDAKSNFGDEFWGHLRPLY